jgi:hypothetical protein
MEVVESLEDDDGLRCVDMISNSDGTFCFKEFRRDPEGGGGWLVTADYSALRFSSKTEAWAAARNTVGWLAQSD